MRRLLSVVFAFAVGACASNYEKFYQPFNNISLSASLLPPEGEPTVIGLDPNPDVTVRNLYARGFAPIGTSGFVGPEGGSEQLTAQARKVGAQIVAVSSKYQNTVSGALPLTLPNNTTSYTSGTATAYGSGGYATGTYSGTTTTYGTQTTYIPYSVDRYEQHALFFGRLSKAGAGVMITNPTETERQELGTNQALKILAIRDESPAYKADLLTGDMILAINGMPPGSVQAAIATLASPGPDAQLTIIRRGTRLQKTIARPGEWPGQNVGQLPATPKIDAAAQQQASVRPLTTPSNVKADTPTAINAFANRSSLGIIGGTLEAYQNGPADLMADPHGAWVDGIVVGSPASVAGIRPGDIIRSFNGNRVSSFDQLNEYAAQSPPGSTARLSVWRGQGLIIVPIKLPLGDEH